MRISDWSSDVCSSDLDLVRVVREDQVGAADVDVEGLAEIVRAHRRAFDVPAGSPPAPRTVPARCIGIRGLPEDEIRRILLVRRHLDTRAGKHVVAVSAREAAIITHRGHIEQHLPLVGIAMTGRDQRFDHRAHLRAMLGPARLYTWPTGAE